MNKKLLIEGSVLLLLVLVTVWLFSRFPSEPRDLGEESAIATLITAYPELESYKTASLPPSSIEVKKAGDGWYVGFIQSGSGLPGILTARCYHVSNAKDIQTIGTYERKGDQTVAGIVLETCTPTFAAEPTPPAPAPVSETPPATGDVLAYGDVTLALNERATFKNLTIRPIAIEEDSRCPADVQCIWAGRVVVRVEVVSGMGKSEGLLELGQPFTTEVESITLTKVLPAEKNSQITVPKEDYRFTFNVVLR